MEKELIGFSFKLYFLKDTKTKLKRFLNMTYIFKINAQITQTHS